MKTLPQLSTNEEFLDGELSGEELKMIVSEIDNVYYTDYKGYTERIGDTVRKDTDDTDEKKENSLIMW